MGATAHTSEGGHIALFAGSGIRIPIQVDHTFCHAAALMSQGCSHFDVGGEAAFFQQLTNSLGGVRPGKHLSGTGVAGSSASGEVYSVLCIPRGDSTIFSGNAVAAMIYPAHGCGHIFQRFLFGKLRHKDHSMIGCVAAVAKNIVNGVL